MPLTDEEIGLATKRLSDADIGLGGGRLSDQDIGLPTSSAVQRLKNTGSQIWGETKRLLRTPGEMIGRTATSAFNVPTEVANRAQAVKSIGLGGALTWPSEEVEKLPGTTPRAVGENTGLRELPRL